VLQNNRRQKSNFCHNLESQQLERKPKVDIDAAEQKPPFNPYYIEEIHLI